jgi:uncharacterized surface protein with fasciclin (FAS1) repeats
MKQYKFFKLLMGLILPLSIVISSCTDYSTEDPKPATNSLMAVISADTTLSLLAAAIRNVSQNSNPRVDLSTILSAPAPARYTIFAPVNAVFRAAGFPQAVVDNPASANTLANVLRYHVIPREIATGSIPTTRTGYVTTLPGTQLFALRFPPALPIPLGNYVNINRLDSPPGSNNFNNLLALPIPVAGVGTVPFPVANFFADNGVLHKINTILMPPPAANTNIVATATAAGLTSLVRVIQYVDANTTPSANLVATLSNPNATFTVFAPNNAAFNFLDNNPADGTLSDAELGAVGGAGLAAILRRHVIANPRYAADLGASQTALLGTLTFSGLVVTNVGSATILSTNVQTGNGIVHVIDNVLR